MEFNINPVAFEIFGIKIMWYAILISLGFILGTFVVTKLAKYAGKDTDIILDILLYAIPAGIIGARAYYVIFNWNYYKLNIMEIFNIRNGGLAIYGGLIAAFTIGYIYSKRKKLNFLEVTDIFVPGISLGQSIGRWGNFINQEAYGSKTSLPWGIIIDGNKVHPTFLYESIGTFLIFIVLYNLFKNRKFNGQILSVYLILYGILRFLIEGLRADSLYLFNFRVSQILSFILVIVGIVIYKIKSKNKNFLV